MKKLTLILSLVALVFVACNRDEPLPPDENGDEDKSTIPHFYINVDNDKEIDTKDDYLPADIRIDGKERIEDYEGRTGIRGRGNSTWLMPKKPYKLKLESKEGLLGMAPYKKWILLNSYLDGTLILESIPYKMGHLLEIPYTNHMHPVELTVNDEYQGFYVFTEHKEVGEERIDIGEDGWLLELDAHFDEPLQFKSDKYDLPVMVKYPKYKNMSESEAQETLDEIRADFELLENLVYDESFPDNDYLDYFDADAFVNYMLVYYFTLNQEINHPKSTYINKPAGEKYQMGIIWDFDWGFGYSGEGTVHFNPTTASQDIIHGNSTMPGSQFFGRIMQDPEIQTLFKERWIWFKTRRYSELKKNVSDWANKIKPIYEKDHEVWGERTTSKSVDDNLENILHWMDLRATYIDQLVSGF